MVCNILNICDVTTKRHKKFFVNNLRYRRSKYIYKSQGSYFKIKTNISKYGLMVYFARAVTRPSLIFFYLNRIFPFNFSTTKKHLIFFCDVTDKNQYIKKMSTKSLPGKHIVQLYFIILKGKRRKADKYQ